MEKLILIIIIVGMMFIGVDSIAQMQTYCTKIGNNISCTSYDQEASSQSYCTSIAGNLTCTTYDDNYNRVRIQQNYEAGQVIGTALGNAVVSAIEAYKKHRRMLRDKQEQWNQFVQDTLAASELACEADPNKFGFTTAVTCRTDTFNINQFLHRHQKDFVPDARNMELMADALDKTFPNSPPPPTAQEMEIAFQSIDKKKLDKKVYLGLDEKDRRPW